MTFGLIVDDELYFKVNADTVRRYVDEGSQPFRYDKKGKVMTMQYYQVPPSVMEDPLQLMDWATQALSVARAAKRAK